MVEWGLLTNPQIINFNRTLFIRFGHTLALQQLGFCLTHYHVEWLTLLRADNGGAFSGRIMVRGK